ncbi:MAG: glycosyltransferase family 4 protein [Fusobacterium sp.]|nr:glycosyltransferase family 4 protein [Fusobacterium sp.]MDO5788760.1 glycosyltransferase family 4 protein [Fusobacterium sp.]
MKKITLLIDNFTPDLGAASFRFESIVKELADRGNQINIIASYPNRIDLDNFEDFKYKNVQIIRINKKKLKENTIQRAFNYFNFFYEAIKVGIKVSKDSDLIIATSPQLLVGVAGAIISKINKKKFILDIRDLWPDIVLDMGVMKRYNPIYIILKILENFMYKQSDYLIYNSPGFKEYLECKYPKENMSLITNGIDDYILEYFKDKQVKIEKKDKYKILYAGNLGIAQDIKILVDLAKRRKDIEVILIGKGSQEKIIVDKIKELQVKNIKLISSIPRIELLNLYEEIDILFLQLKDIKMFEKTIPSKIFEYIATQKPIIYGVEGIARKILEKEFKRKYYFKANNLDNLEETLNKLVKDLEEKKYVKPDIEKLIANYSRSNLAKRYREIVEKV